MTPAILFVPGEMILILFRDERLSIGEAPLGFFVDAGFEDIVGFPGLLRVLCLALFNHFLQHARGHLGSMCVLHVEAGERAVALVHHVKRHAPRSVDSFVSHRCVSLLEPRL